MQGHLPTPPHPVYPVGLAPAIGYLATREPRPLDDHEPVEREWWEIDDDEEEEWPPRHRGVVKVTAIVLSISLLVAGVGTLLEVVLSGRRARRAGTRRAPEPGCSGEPGPSVPP